KKEVKEEEEEREIKEEPIDEFDSDDLFANAEYELDEYQMNDVLNDETEVDGVTLQSKMQMIKDAIDIVLIEHSPRKFLKDNVRKVLYAVFVHKKISAQVACKLHDVSTQSARHYIDKVRSRLGPELDPFQKISTIKRKRQMEGERRVRGGEEGLVDIDGITVPYSMRALTRHLAEGKLDFSQARPFNGTIEELKAKVVEILRIFFVDSEVIAENAEAVMMVNADGYSICETVRRTNLHYHKCSKVSNLIKIFIDFHKSKCTHQFELLSTENIEKKTIQPRSDFLLGANSPAFSPSLFAAVAKKVHEKMVAVEKAEPEESIKDDDPIDTKITVQQETSTSTVTIDGITVSDSPTAVSRLISQGKLDCSRARPFEGSKDELKEKLIEILLAFRYSGDFDSMAEALLAVAVDEEIMKGASIRLGVSKWTLWTYSKIVRMFIDFRRSPCTPAFARMAHLNALLGKGKEKEELVPIYPHPSKMPKIEEMDNSSVDGIKKSIVKEEPIEHADE
ncbi:hypothetical protein PFISCL1PPCAC_955, partial [Pristionchus fissidentatus]